MRYSILNQTEIAFVAALKSIQGSGPLGAGNVYAAQSVDIDAVVEMPATTVTASAQTLSKTSLGPSIEMSPGDGLFELRLTFTIETQIDAEPTNPANDIHHARVEAVRDFVEDYDTLAPLLAAGPAPLFLSALVLETEEQDPPKGRIFTSILTYYVAVS